MTFADITERLKSGIVRHHGQISMLRQVPLRVIGIISLVVSVNMVVWLAVGIVLVCIVAITDDHRYGSDYVISTFMCTLLHCQI